MIFETVYYRHYFLSYLVWLLLTCHNETVVYPVVRLDLHSEGTALKQGRPNRVSTESAFHAALKLVNFCLLGGYRGIGSHDIF